MLGNVFASDSGISAHLVPVYAFLLGMLYKICGVDTPAAWMSKGVMAVVFSGAAIFLLAWLARRAKLTPVVGLAAVSFLVLGKKQIWQETRGDWDHTFTALFLILTILLALNLQDDRWSSWRGTAAWGLTMGFGALLNPAITLPTGAIVMMSHFLVLAADRRRLLVQFAIAASAAACVIAPWTYRNYRAFHAFVPLRSNFGLELCLGNSPRADGTTFATNKTDHPHVNPIQLQLYKEMGEIRYMELQQDEAMQWIKASPRRFAILTGRRVLMFWFGDTIAKTDWSSKGLRDKFLGCLLGISACGGLTWLAVIRHPYRWTFFAAMVGPMTIFAFTHVYDRYRYPRSMGCSSCLASSLGAWCWLRLPSDCMVRPKNWGRSELVGCVEHHRCEAHRDWLLGYSWPCTLDASLGIKVRKRRPATSFLRDPNRKNYYSKNNYKKMRQMSEQARDKNA